MEPPLSFLLSPYAGRLPKRVDLSPAVPLRRVRHKISEMTLSCWACAVNGGVKRLIFG